MTTFVSNQGPFMAGLRPKAFFASRKKMINDSIKKSDGGKKYYPGWSSGKKSENKPKLKFRTASGEFMLMLPWALVLIELFYLVVA